MEDLLVEWLKRHDGVTSVTRERYQGVVRNYLVPALGGVLVGDLSTPLIDTAVRNIYVDFSRHAAQRSLKILSMSCKWAVRMSLLERDFTAEVPTPGRSRRSRPWRPTEEQIDLLLTLLRADYEVAARHGPRSPSGWLSAEIMAKTGARVGEVCAARWENVDWAAGTLTLSDTVVFEGGKNVLRGHLKNGDPFRVSYLPQSLLEILSDFRQENGLIVSARGGGLISTSNLRRAWRRVYDQAGISELERIRPHDLRRAVGTRLTEKLGIDAAANQLGDTRTTTERHYAAPTYRGPREARDVLD